MILVKRGIFLNKIELTDDIMQEIAISTNKKHELVDITPQIHDMVKKSNVKEGICIIYVPHATAAVTINENADPNIQEDIIKAINKAIPEHNNYLHDSVDNNAAAHIKSSIIGVSKIIPIKNNKLTLGTWQDVFFCEFDGPRSNRRIIINIIKQ